MEEEVKKMGEEQNEKLNKMEGDIKNLLEEGRKKQEEELKSMETKIKDNVNK